ncbi:hypothetical protein [Streptomyces echinatus]|uniref:hypothetical protein n=1 Tax=Streptomyces echinatus TaxID=67293 RepID=UPI0037B2B545
MVGYGDAVPGPVHVFSGQCSSRTVVLPFASVTKSKDWVPPVSPSASLPLPDVRSPRCAGRGGGAGSVVPPAAGEGERAGEGGRDEESCA